MENKTGKYIQYAIGEIFLVIVGILIALQINEWNSQRIEARALRNDLEYVLEDLEKDKLALLASRDQRIKGVGSCSKILDQYMMGEPMPFIFGNEETENIPEILYERKFKRNEEGFEKVLSSKLFQTEKFKSLREKIDEYGRELDRLIYDEERLNYFIEENELKMFEQGTHQLIYEYARSYKGFANPEIEVRDFDWVDLLSGESALKSIFLRYEDDVNQFLIPQYNRTVEVGEELKTSIESHLGN